MRASALGLLLLSIAPSCTPYTSHVKADSTALGRIVIYRNGVAFYERRAKATDDRLTLTVPNDKVDDFLKSLTVTDAATGEALPVSFPTFAAASGAPVDMTVSLPGKKPRDLVLTYIVEAASWKPSYRVVLQNDGKVKVQGWAIVDNTSAEDWSGVTVGVGASSAMSFRYDLRSVRSVERQTLADRERFAYAPPTGGAVHQEGEAKEQVVLGMLGDEEISGDLVKPEAPVPSAPPAEPEPALISARRGGAGSGGGSRATSRGAMGAPSRPERDADRSLADSKQQAAEKLGRLAAELKRRRGTVVIEGYAAPGEREPVARSLDRANTLRNQLIEAGVAPAQLKAEGRGLVQGNAPGTRIVEAKDQMNAKVDSTQMVSDGSPIGESHFESNAPVTVKRGTSAMVSVLAGDTEGEVVYLYDPFAERGNEKFAFRAVKFKNPSSSTLEAGPVTFYGEARFIGEGITDAIPPGATAVIPFAFDRQVRVERTTEAEDGIDHLLTLSRGVLRVEVKHKRRHRLRIVNRLNQDTTVYVRHMVQQGWNVLESPPVYEKIEEAHLFQVPLEAGASETVEIVESTPLQRTLDLRSTTDLELVRVYLEKSGSAKPSPKFTEAVQKILKLHGEVVSHEQSISGLREQADEYRVRLDELAGQMYTLKNVKGASDLISHLKKKTMDVSERIHKATIETVERQEKLLLAKVELQNAVAELTLEEAAR